MSGKKLHAVEPPEIDPTYATESAYGMALEARDELAAALMHHGWAFREEHVHMLPKLCHVLNLVDTIAGECGAALPKDKAIEIREAVEGGAA